MKYLGRVNEAMAEFEEILWEHMKVVAQAVILAGYANFTH